MDEIEHGQVYRSADPRGGPLIRAAVSEREELRDLPAQALIEAARCCDGQCGLEERKCLAAHPITMVTWSEPARTEGCVVEGRVPALADVAVATVGPVLDRAKEAEEELEENTGVMRALWQQRDTAEATVGQVQDWLGEWGPQLPANARETLAQALSGPKQDSGAEP